MNFSELLTKIDEFAWGPWLLVIMVGTGIYLTVRTKFLQFDKFGYAMKNTLGKITSKQKAGIGEITPFQAVTTALAGTVGVGSVAGATGAIAIGGPGAVFWMWVSALFGMVTKYFEVTLAVRFRERNEKGEWAGGPMYYIKNGLGKKWMWLAYIFCIFGFIATFGTGNATQVNTIVSSINTALANFKLVPAEGSSTLNLIFGIVIALLVGIVLIGGIQRLGSVTEKLVPFMAVIYIILAVGVVVINYDMIPAAFKMIFVGAFSPRSVTGGVIGSMFLTMRKGISRGIFSNEAGLGSASIAHASSSEKEPAKQGLFGIFEVFVDTILICTLTALVVICGNRANITFGEAAGAELTIAGFSASYGGWVTIFTAVAMCCFAFSTVLGWGLYGSRCVEFILGEKASKPFLVVYSLVCIIGATLDLGLLWNISDTFNGLMVIPNLTAVALLSPKVIATIKEYFAKQKEAK